MSSRAAQEVRDLRPELAALNPHMISVSLSVNLGRETNHPDCCISATLGSCPMVIISDSRGSREGLACTWTTLLFSTLSIPCRGAQLVLCGAGGSWAEVPFCDLGK